MLYDFVPGEYFLCIADVKNKGFVIGKEKQSTSFSFLHLVMKRPKSTLLKPILYPPVF